MKRYVKASEYDLTDEQIQSYIYEHMMELINEYDFTIEELRSEFKDYFSRQVDLTISKIKQQLK